MRTLPKLFAEPHTKLAPFLTAGYPEKSMTLDLALAAESAGAHMLEIGMPFSDPIADGPVIQAASQTALDNGTTLPWIMETVAEMAGTVKIPIVLMGYYNPILKMGSSEFIRQASQAGVAGLIIPDLPLGVGDSFFAEAQSAGMSIIPLVAPNTPNGRISEISSRYSDLLYAVAIMGVTGSKQQDDTSTANYLTRVRKASSAPFVVGFGIETPDDAARIGTYADGIVVGSALLRKIEESSDPVASVTKYIASLADAIR